MKEISLTQDQITLVDDNDFKRISKHRWEARRYSRGSVFYVYAIRRITKSRKTTTIRMHREILGLLATDKMDTDHMNGNTLDNRRLNLRVASRRQNTYNSRLYRNNTLGFKGVMRNTGGRFTARICLVSGKRKSVGTFRTLIEAARAYNKAACEYYGAFAALNKIRERED
jgi:hypothetical protein